jgi:hypothetical protein
LAVWLGGAAYRAELPSQAVAGYIYYYLRAENGGYDVTLPEARSEQAAYRFLVGDPVELIVEGFPQPVTATSFRPTEQTYWSPARRISRPPAPKP